MYGRDENDSFTLPAPYVEAMRRAGALPLLVPPGVARFDELLGRIDGLILGGGGDLDPGLYGGDRHETIYMVDGERDASELELAVRAIR